MVTWTLGQDPVRVVDAGAGSGRFSALIARRAPDVGVVAIDCDPVATLMSRAALAVIGHGRATALCSDYTRLELPTTDGRTAFLGVTRPTFATTS